MTKNFFYVSIKNRISFYYMLKSYESGDLELLTELEQKYSDLAPQMSERISRYRIYKDFFDGSHEQYNIRPEGRRNHKTNLCSVAVREIKDFVMGDFFDFHVPRVSETAYEKEYLQEAPDIEDEENRSEFIEKLLRSRAFKDPMAKREFGNAIEDSLIFGDAILYYPYDSKKKTFDIQSLFPGFVRCGFSSLDYEEMDYIFCEKVISVERARELYGTEIDSDPYAPALYWDRQTVGAGEFVVVKTYYDKNFIIKHTREKIFSKKKNTYHELPIKLFSCFRNPHSPFGVSYLHEIIPIQKEFNEAISDEADIVKMYANPKAIIKNATKKELDQLKRMWASGLIISTRNIELQIVEFKSTIFPIEERIRSIMERFYKVSGLPPVVFGTPEGSINTGPALTVQFSPTIRKARHIWGNWEPKIFDMIQFFLKEFERMNEFVGDKKMKEIINKNYEVQLIPKFLAPRDESMISNTAIGELNAGLISKLTAMKKIGVKSPEDEFTVMAYENFNPFISPEKVANMQAALQGGKPMPATPGPVTPAIPPAGMPMAQGGKPYV